MPATPRASIGSPRKATNPSPTTPTKPNIANPPQSASRCVRRPSTSARLARGDSSVSTWFFTSYSSLITLVPAWSAIEASKTRRKSGKEKAPSCQARALPTSTGTTEAVHENGRPISSQAAGLPLGIAPPPQQAAHPTGGRLSILPSVVEERDLSSTIRNPASVVWVVDPHHGWKSSLTP